MRKDADELLWGGLEPLLDQCGAYALSQFCNLQEEEADISKEERSHGKARRGSPGDMSVSAASRAVQRRGASPF